MGSGTSSLREMKPDPTPTLRPTGGGQPYQCRGDTLARGHGGKGVDGCLEVGTGVPAGPRPTEDGQPYLGGRDAADRDGQPYLGDKDAADRGRSALPGGRGLMSGRGRAR